MLIEVNFDGVIATINDGKWSTNKSDKLSLDKTKDREGLLEDALNSLTAGDLAMGEYGTIARCDVDYESATSLSRLLGGKITDLSKHRFPGRTPPGAVN